MPYIYEKVDTLQDKPKVRNKECVALVQHYIATLPRSTTWKEGKAVLGNKDIVKGTAIATFVDGRYLSLPTGNHAAFYISQDANGIVIMDQWADDKKKPVVSKWHVRKKGKHPNGKYIDPSNNAEAYSVIE